MAPIGKYFVIKFYKQINFYACGYCNPFSNEYCHG